MKPKTQMDCEFTILSTNGKYILAEHPTTEDMVLVELDEKKIYNVDKVMTAVNVNDEAIGIPYRDILVWGEKVGLNLQTCSCNA